jgi:two-component system sensor histidine kinase BaeS
VLSNLVSNALRHTPDQGTITLSARKDADVVVLNIQDTGSGITPEHLPHIFERFYRADASRHQNQNESGLGLAITKSFIEAHGGTISASSNPGEGTTITIQLPVKDDSDLETA